MLPITCLLLNEEEKDLLPKNWRREYFYSGKFEISEELEGFLQKGKNFHFSFFSFPCDHVPFALKPPSSPPPTPPS